MLCADILQLWQLKCDMTCLNKEKNRFSNFYTVSWMMKFLKWFLSLFEHSNLSTWLMFFGQLIFSMRIYSFHRFYATWTNFWCTNIIRAEPSIRLSSSQHKWYLSLQNEWSWHEGTFSCKIYSNYFPSTSNFLQFDWFFNKMETYKVQEHRILCKVFS